MKEPKWTKNQRIECKVRIDRKDCHKVAFVKRSYRKGVIFKKWWYEVCEFGKGLAVKPIFQIPEENIFGLVEYPNEKKDKLLNVKNHKTYKDFGEMKELINNNE